MLSTIVSPQEEFIHSVIITIATTQISSWLVVTHTMRHTHLITMAMAEQQGEKNKKKYSWAKEKINIKYNQKKKYL